jgi:hypothetical protein
MRRVDAVAVLLALGLVGCRPEEQTDPLPPLDQLSFYFPIGLATTQVAGQTTLLVASSNFDLRYSADEGGTLLSIDHQGPLGSDRLRGAARIASYAGAVAVADEVTCPGIGAGASALVASRFDDSLYRFGILPDGSLSCGPGCTRRTGGDPFAVTVACRSDQTRRTVYVGWLDPPESTRGSGAGAWVTELDLDNPLKPPRAVDVGDGPISSMAYDAETDRLWLASQSSGARALLHSVALFDPRWVDGPAPWEAVDTVDLFPDVWGAELRSLALGSPVPGAPRRLYASVRLYDAESQASTGDRPGGDIGGALVVLDVTEGTDGRPAVVVRGVVPLGPSVGDVAVVRRAAPLRDVVVATVLDGDLLFVYDAETEAVARIIGHDSLGLPLLGDQPIALAVDQDLPGTPAWVYVAAFGGHSVTRFLLDPADPSAAPTLMPIGGLVP